ncbi:MAG: single-stranded DNA-binding protein [Pseudomonadota bacterium]|nr:single-stranded DNA-binding protein [Pseudomonadota bacterium]
MTAVIHYAPTKMTTTIQFYGRLCRPPEQRTTAAGKPMTTGTMVVDLGRDAEAPEWFSLVAFGTIAEALAKHAKDDMVAISGRLTKSSWKSRDGVQRTGFSVLVDSIQSARTVRPAKAPKAGHEQPAELP